MVRHCDILNCNNNSKATKGISYHEIPLDPLIRSQWLNLSNANSGFREKTFQQSLIFKIHYTQCEQCKFCNTKA